MDDAGPWRYLPGMTSLTDGVTDQPGQSCERFVSQRWRAVVVQVAVSSCGSQVIAIQDTLAKLQNQLDALMGLPKLI